MTDTALEVSLNGKVLYIVGMEGWSMISAQVSGHRHTPAMLEQIRSQVPTDQAHLYEDSTEFLGLQCFVGVPDPGDPSSSSGQPYQHHRLKFGDIVTVRVVESSDPDRPLPSRPRGHQIVIAESKSDVDKN